MAEKELYLWSVQLYDVASAYPESEDWRRYETIYCAASDMDEASKLAKKNASDNQVVISINQMQGARFYI